MILVLGAIIFIYKQPVYYIICLKRQSFPIEYQILKIQLTYNIEVVRYQTDSNSIGSHCHYNYSQTSDALEFMSQETTVSNSVSNTSDPVAYTIQGCQVP